MIVIERSDHHDRKTISVFVENKPGRLAEFIDILSEHKIDMRAMSIAETQDFGILRIIVDNPEKAAEVIQNAHYVFSVTPVLAVAIPDERGACLRSSTLWLIMTSVWNIHMLLLPDKRKWLIWYSVWLIMIRRQKY